MKTFKTFLTELMDNPVDYQSTYDASGTMFIAKFDVGDVEYRAEIIGGAPYKEGDYEIFFEVRGEASFGMDITGTGNAATVFSTVAAIIKEHFRRHKNTVEAYIFTAKEPSRRKLYKRLAGMMKSKLRFSKVETEIAAGELMFVIKR